MSGKIFISYRREDSIDVTGRIYDWLVLAHSIPRDDIFMDVDSIPPGVDFRVHIEKAIARSGLMLVIVGRQWASCVDAGGRRRLDDPGDFVRLEVEAGLRSNLPLVPVLVQNAAMPAPEHLPASLAPFVYRNALPVRSGTDFPRDMERLLKAVETFRTRAPQPPPPPILSAPSSGFGVVLGEVGPKKIQVIRAVMEATGLGLKEAKDLAESTPRLVLGGLSREDADRLRSELAALGASATVRPQPGSGGH